jgi:hypothetical protein
MRDITVSMLTDRLRHARDKHPAWNKDLSFCLSVLRLELGELEHAIKYETDARVRDEALDVAAVALRIVEGDWR